MPFKAFLNKRRTKNYLATSAKELGFAMPDQDAGAVFIITTAFNNSQVIKHQARLMDKNLKDKFVHVIVDNSDKAEASERIRNICTEFSRPYIKLPQNAHGRGSNSHALALNWCIKQLILQFKPAYFGFIDHDIYPVKKEEIISLLKKQKIYGLKQERGSTWYLWPGLCFFKFDESVKDFDFSPGEINGVPVDTGGKLYKNLYSKLDPENISFPAQSYENLREGNIFQSDKVEYIGNWMHSFNGSYWMDVPDKENELEQLINKHLAN